jgi:O-antigen ligase
MFNLATRPSRPLLHLAVAVVAGFDVIVAYTRTMWVALTIVIVVAAVVARPVRRALVQSIPIVLPVLLLAVIVVLRFAPDLATTMIDRISTPAGQDTSVQWREMAYRAVLSGTSDEPLLGVGFGRTTSFSINGMPNFIEGDPHNGYIYVVAGAGIIGAVALALVIAAYLWDVSRRWLWAKPAHRPLVAWCFATWLLFMFHAASEPVFTSPPRILLIWVCMLLPAVVVAPVRAVVPRVIPRPPATRRRRRVEFAH